MNSTLTAQYNTFKNTLTSLLVVGSILSAGVYLVSLFQTTELLAVTREMEIETKEINSTIAVLELEYLNSSEGLDEGIFGQYGFIHPEQDLVFLSAAPASVDVAHLSE